MTDISITGLTKRFGGKTPTLAIDNLELEVAPGEFLVLLGPSGCGKTTTLRCIAGLETAEEGRISSGGRTYFDAEKRINIPPNKRNLGMVFQSYALWPHMTVRKNIGYPLRNKGVKGDEAKQTIEATARLVHTHELLDRYPNQLSGGQQQRVALSRGLVAKPDLVLFDEPLSNLDARLRDFVRTEIHELHSELGFTAVYVTHDQVEALALGDRLAIMRDGKLEQLATPEQTFEQPASDYVAGFIGMGNRLTVERIEGAWTHESEPVSGLVFDTASETLVLRCRAEDIRIIPADESPPADTIVFRGIVIQSEFGGRHLDVTLTVGATRAMSRIPAGAPGSWARTLNAGQSVIAYMHRHDVKAFDDKGELIRSLERVVSVPGQ